MAIPPLPADDSAGNVWTASKVNAVYDLLELFRDTRPVFKGECVAAELSDPPFAASGSTKTLGLGAGGAFFFAPEINVGSWTVNAADANPESLVVPEAGMYRFTIWVNWEANTSNRRQTALLLNGSVVEASRNRVEASSSSTTGYSHSVLVDCAASDDIDVQVFQDSGSTLDVEVWLSAEWLVST